MWIDEANQIWVKYDRDYGDIKADTANCIGHIIANDEVARQQIKDIIVTIQYINEDIRTTQLIIYEHIGNFDVHITQPDRDKWDAKTDQEDFLDHTGNNIMHITSTERDTWNAKADKTALDNKVDKIPGKQLSTEDYTTAEKTKLAGLPTGASLDADLSTRLKSENIIAGTNMTVTRAGNNLTFNSLGGGGGGEAASSVYAETSTSSSLRAVNIPNIASYEDMLNKVFYIQAGMYGTTGAQKLNVNGLGDKSLYFGALGNGGLAATPPWDFWVRTGGVYATAYNGEVFVVLNPQPRNATTTHYGTTRLEDTLTSTSTAFAATANAVKKTNDRLDNLVGDIETALDAIISAMSEV